MSFLFLFLSSLCSLSLSSLPTSFHTWYAYSSSGLLYSAGMYAPAHNTGTIRVAATGTNTPDTAALGNTIYTWYVPSDYTGTIQVSRHYSAGTTEGPLLLLYAFFFRTRLFAFRVIRSSSINNSNSNSSSTNNNIEQQKLPVQLYAWALSHARSRARHWKARGKQITETK